MADKLRMPGEKNKMKSFKPTKESIQRSPIVLQRDMKTGGTRVEKTPSRKSDTQRILENEFKKANSTKAAQYKKTRNK